MDKQETLYFIFQYIHGNLPVVFEKYFIYRNEPTEMIVEQRKRFQPPIHNYDIGASAIKVVGSKLFNDKASELKLNNSIKTYRTKVKQMNLPYPDI